MSINFNKTNGLVPVIIQDYQTLQVLMLGYMNDVAYEKTKSEKRVTFFSRSKNRLWTKGETSGNFLEVISVYEDCDEDTILIMAKPKGPTCHNGTMSCFATTTETTFLYELENTLKSRIESNDANSYTVSLVQKGINKVAQKVGEEAVELVIEAKDNNADLFLNEAADLMYHYLLLLQVKGFSLHDVESVLKKRSK
ncbi:bifunctional phosphoribosyl-AMP cyclohydrolase/phosphoribosyl-ATP diphosphatase HisIE [Flavobacterium sp. SUN052]|uniref:bifunctional phosphoribosyl-AMP cyclohydrolase/phosphoribosyl-ATP diphosphatase HisIE n=1 Tax=Flavobacterium sp. SUN052 TaxID=3002441 RepID=UPI00237EB8ED|nr:bifunctional phosphoribosyl-AMP cyclohydrolase/phosphoribosyl-ATP diphosphatase HisIE [Flavobacterium sp. SUN052]MEC4003413.1 bifunctional phosphoribosyl-AMP cyclohydrolase/phosphoribosyl-ATP diphosphatase HisIE [Flavobacterium sp. SUN052]